MTEEVLPLVSVMIPTFNAPRFCKLALESALAQNYPQIEIIVCDNSDNEKTSEMIAAYLSDPRLRYIRNRGAKSKAANFAPFATLARGDYLQWLMHDDILAPDKIAKMAACLQKFPQVTLVTSLRGIIDEKGRKASDMMPMELPIAGEYQIFDGASLGRLALAFAANIFGEPSAFMFRRRDLTHHYWRAECRGYRVISDVAMCLELLEKGDALVWREPLSFFRRHAAQEGQNIDVILLSRIEWVNLMREYLAKKVFLESAEDLKKPLAGFLREYGSEYPLLKEKASLAMQKAYEDCMDEIKNFVG